MMILQKVKTEGNQQWTATATTNTTRKSKGDLFSEKWKELENVEGMFPVQLCLDNDETKTKRIGWSYKTDELSMYNSMGMGMGVLSHTQMCWRHNFSHLLILSCFVECRSQVWLTLSSFLSIYILCSLHLQPDRTLYSRMRRKLLEVKNCQIYSKMWNYHFISLAGEIQLGQCSLNIFRV